MNLSEVLGDKINCIFCRKPCKLLSDYKEDNIKKISLGLTEWVEAKVTLSLVNNSIRIRVLSVKCETLAFMCENSKHSQLIKVDLTIDYKKKIYTQPSIQLEAYSLKIGGVRNAVKNIRSIDGVDWSSEISRNNKVINKNSYTTVKNKDEFLNQVNRLFLML